MSNAFKIPDDTLIYAIGDVHGRLDLLKSLHEKILTDSKQRSQARKVIVYLGDYIDRGMHSKGVLEFLTANPMKEFFECVYLKGNHESAFCEFLNQNFQETTLWLKHGGKECLMSYGVKSQDIRKPYEELALKAGGIVPTQHMEFMENLKLFHKEGEEYIFVHAGVDPEKPFDEQTPRDFTFSREKFLSYTGEFPLRIVFGHTIHEEPLVKRDRLGVDTGAYATGKLTAAVLHEDKTEFLQT